MEALYHAPLKAQLADRRKRLLSAIADVGAVEDLVRLLQAVDAALGRMDAGSFGFCEICQEEIDKPHLLANPLVRYCLCNLSDKQQRALENDLELASRIQVGLLPPQDVTENGWRAHYRYQPLGPVSGDYCDLVSASSRPEEIFFVVGDVSGKGVAAALLMAHLHASFRSLIQTGLGLDQLVERANRLLVESAIPTHYATLVCGKADRSGRVEMCNAGHNPPLVVRAGRVSPVESTGLPLGVLDGRTYSVKQIHLDAGDSLFLYTDGVTEMRNGSDEEYGPVRLASLLERRHALPPRLLVDACLADLGAFASGLSRTDDLTLMVLRRDGADG